MRAWLPLLLSGWLTFLPSPAPGQTPTLDDPSRCVDLWNTVPEPGVSTLEAPVRAHLTEARAETLQILRDGSRSRLEHARAVGSLAETYHAYGFDETADSMYGVARCLAPGEVSWAYAQARIAETRGDLTRAEELYFEAMRSESGYPVLFRMAELAHTRGDLVRAQLLYRQALDEPASRAPALAALGQTALARGDYEEAVERLEEALAMVPAADLLHYPLSLAYRRLGKQEEAQRHLAMRGRVGVAPRDPLEDRLRRIPRGARLLLLRGRAALRANRVEEAIAALAQAVAQDPRNTSARVALAVASAQAGDRERAQSELEAVIQLEPGNHTALFNLAVLAIEGGDRDKARELLRKALSEVPDDEEIRRLLESLSDSG